MHKYILAAIAVALISTNSFAGSVRGEKDPLEVTYIKDRKANPDQKFQEQLRNSSSWKNYINAHEKWYVEFNEATQTPHRAYGKPIQVSGNTPVEAAMNFIENNLRDWNLPLQDLKYVSDNNSGKYYNVFYKQMYNGLEILNSRVFVKLTKNFSVSSWGADVFNVSMSTTPAIDATTILTKVKSGINDQVTDVTTPSLKILPVPTGRTFSSHLVYEITVSTINEQNIPGKYYTLIDANSGEILYRHNNVSFFEPLSTDVKVVGTVYEFNPYIPQVVLPLRNLKIVSGTSTYYTDSVGDFTVPGTNPIPVKFALEGLWSRVLTAGGSVVPFVNDTLVDASDTINMDPVASIRHMSGYFHVNNIHDFMKTFFPTFTGLDFPLRTRIDLTTGSCNAFYSGTDINFYAAGNGCNCYSQVADIVYHEYGHGINDRFYQAHGASFQNGAMNEGYADVWGLSLTKNAVLGIGESSSDPNSYIRRYDVGRKVYPRDIHGEVHDDGEIIAGAWYDVQLNLNSWHDMTDLFSRTFNDVVTGPDGTEGVVYRDVLLAALEEDDDDADLNNGTPHDNAIIDAFALHGIYLLNNASFHHTQILSTTANAGTPVVATLANDLAWLTPDMELHYRTTNSGPYTMLPMLHTTGVNYSATIPQQTAGTIISYYVQLRDISGSSLATYPEKADSIVSNIPYFILVNCIRDKVEDFDGHQSAGWLTGIADDNALRGKWIIAPPVVSLKAGDTCQTGTQITPGGVNCAVTGNALSPSSPNYNSDVDGGRTTLQSPPIDISGSLEPVITYWRWYTNDQGSAAEEEDYWQTYISGDGVNFIPVEDILVPDHSWRRFAFKVSDYLPSATEITLRFVADDTLQESVVEAAVDDIEVYSKNLDNGIKSISNLNNISLYPNPAASTLKVNLNLEKPENISFDVVNNLGQTVLTSSTEVSAGKSIRNIDIQSLDNGMYYLVVKSRTENLQKAFSVLR